jgi:hypothetical protein
MKTSLFNLHEIKIEDRDLIIEFYAGDIFDIYSGILLLSAFRGGFYPTKGTTWGSLFERTGISFGIKSPGEQERISDNILLFRTTRNECFEKLVAIELTDLIQRNSFTLATLKTRYKELANFLESYPTAADESISVPLLGTGNQGISLEDSISELLKTLNQLKKTKLKIIRVFARNFESIGVLNKKINEILNRNEAIHTSLLDAAIEETRQIAGNQLSTLSANTISNLLTITAAENTSLNICGLNGRIFAETICNEFLVMYNIANITTNLDSKIRELTQAIRQDRPYVLSYLRLLQTYGNQVAHTGNPNLNYQDAAAIIIAIVRIVDFYEFKIKQQPAIEIIHPSD